jgi:hypothetical protein
VSDPHFDMQPVSSSTIAAVGYDPNTETMRVQFHKTGTYEYAGVPQSEFDVMMQSASIGSHFSQFIKGTYEGFRV